MLLYYLLINKLKFSAEEKVNSDEESEEDEEVGIQI